MLIPLWESAPWWHLVCPDTNNFSKYVVDWVWLPRDDQTLFVAGNAPELADHGCPRGLHGVSVSSPSYARGIAASGGLPRLR